MNESTDPLRSAILVVDDQESNVRLLEHTLRRGGYVAVTSTTDPSAVCALHEENHYDLILLDLQMPVLSGFGVMEALRCLTGRDRPAILVLSADPSSRLPSLEAGATSFLSKPFVLADVLSTVKSILETGRPNGLPPPAEGTPASAHDAATDTPDETDSEPITRRASPAGENSRSLG